MYKNNHFDKWVVNLTMTDTLDLIQRFFYKLDKNILIMSKLSEIQKILIDDYQLISMNQFSSKQFIVENNKVTPVPKHNNGNDYDGEYFTYFEIKNKLPINVDVGTLHNESLNQFLKNENACNANIINGKNKTQYTNVLLKVHSNNNNCIEEIQYLPELMGDYYKALKNLNKGGNLYVNLNYYYHNPNVIFLQYILSLFESVEYINNQIVSNKIGHNMIKFNNYSGTKPTELKLILKEYKIKIETNKNHQVKIINNFYCNKHQINGNIIQKIFDNNIDENFVSFLNKIYKQQNEYLKMLIKRVNFIDYKKIFRHLNNQIDTAVGWCETHKIEVSDIYKENKVIMKPHLIRKYFKSERGVDLSKIKMTSDALYSVSFPDVADEMSKLIKNAMPNIKTIVDGTANVGGNTLSFASHFDHVISVEISDKTFDVLKNNVNTYGRKNVKLINDDFLNIMGEINADVIFMDPPWTGTFYKMYENMDLFLSGINIIDIIPKLNCKMVALKLPSNYNIKGLLEKVNNLQIFKIFGIILILIKK